jgi:hypothetical protein
MRPSLHERRIEVNDIDLPNSEAGNLEFPGIYFMCHDCEDGRYDSCHVTFTASEAKELAGELFEAASQLDAIHKYLLSKSK